MDGKSGECFEVGNVSHFFSHDCVYLYSLMLSVPTRSKIMLTLGLHGCGGLLGYWAHLITFIAALNKSDMSTIHKRHVLSI